MSVKQTIQTISVLMIDDYHLRFELSQMLKELGFFVCDIVQNQALALSSIKTNAPDIVAINLDLNFKNNANLGQEIWREFKIPIVYLVTKHDEKKIKKAMQNEPYGFFYKSINPQDLKTNIENIHHKHSFLKQFLHNKTIKKSDFLYLKGGFRLEKTSLNLDKNKTQIPLTSLEKRLFYITQDYEVTPIDVIYSYIYRDDFADYGKLRTLIYRLHKKLGVKIFAAVSKRGYKILRA